MKTGSYPNDELEYWQDVSHSMRPIVRMLMVFAIGVQIIFMFEDWFTANEHFAVLFKAKLTSISILIGVYYSAGTTWGRKYWEISILIVAISLIATISFQATIIQQAFMMPLLAIILTFSSGTLLAWQLRYQITLTVICIVAVLVNMIMLQDPPYFPPTREAISGVVFSLSSILLALYSHQRRIALWRAERTLKESDERFRQLSENSADIIWIWSPTRKIQYVSPAYTQFTGRDTESLYDNHNEVLEVIHPDDRAAFDEALESVMKGETQKMDLNICHIDGEVFSLECWSAPILDDQGKVIRCVGIWRDVTERVRLVDDLNVMATTDHLTKAYNRRFFFDVAGKETKRALRKQSPLSIIIFDIDNFKNLNDTYGHQVGDEVLVGLSSVCMQMFRGEDVFARFGGEEFIVLLPDTDSDEAMDIAERIRQNLSEHKFTSDEKTIPVTVSAGVVSWKVERVEADINTLISQADQAMYYSKSNGRNQVSVYRTDMSSDVQETQLANQ